MSQPIKRPATCSYYNDAAGDSRWHVVAVNGNIIAASTEGYVGHADCARSLEITVLAALPLLTHEQRARVANTLSALSLAEDADGLPEQ